MLLSVRKSLLLSSTISSVDSVSSKSLENSAIVGVKYSIPWLISKIEDEKISCEEKKTEKKSIIWLEPYLNFLY